MNNKISEEIFGILGVIPNDEFFVYTPDGDCLFCVLTSDLKLMKKIDGNMIDCSEYLGDLLSGKFSFSVIWTESEIVTAKYCKFCGYDYIAKFGNNIYAFENEPFICGININQAVKNRFNPHWSYDNKHFEILCEMPHLLNYKSIKVDKIIKECGDV